MKVDWSFIFMIGTFMIFGYIFYNIQESVKNQLPPSDSHYQLSDEY